jgi:hypothetical protein
VSWASAGGEERDWAGSGLGPRGRRKGGGLREEAWARVGRFRLRAESCPPAFFLLKLNFLLFTAIFCFSFSCFSKTLFLFFSVLILKDIKYFSE